MIFIIAEKMFLASWVDSFLKFIMLYKNICQQDIWLQFLKDRVSETILVWKWTFCMHKEILGMYK